MLVGVDVGGTFTDAVVFDGVKLHTAKSPTTPSDQSRGVIAAIELAIEKAGAEAAEVGSLAHGTTVGTNALLEERGARTALVATAGFTDLLDIARQKRPSLYHLCAPKPGALVADEDRLGVDERIGPAQVVRELTDEELERVVTELERLGVEAVAVCLLFAYRDPAHEARITAALRQRLEGVHVSASHEVLAQFREYERCSTTVIDAYLSPLLGDYLDRLVEATDRRGLPEPQVMRSSGGLAVAAEAARSGAWSVLSGPAGGAVGAALLARLSGDGEALGFDMGGTSCDVCVIEAGEVRRTDSREIGGRIVQLPMVDVHTVGAGGGSIAWRDHGGALRVGPRSAGAEPGPACYGRGGSEPTVSDADLLLGRLGAGGELAGGVELDREAAERAIAGLAGELGLDPVATAEGIVRVADAEMLRALRVVTVERGVDPRRFALLPFGGAGPLHAASIAEQLDVRRILCPRASGVLSALGLAASERRRDTARTLLLSGGELTRGRITQELEALEATISEGFEQAERHAAYELRYHGQSFELAIEAGPGAEPAELRERFEAEHERRYGYRDPDSEVELVNLRLALVLGGTEPEPEAADGSLERGEREVRFGGEWTRAQVLRGEPAEGVEVEGPCVFELPEATLALPVGWRAVVDAHGTIVAERGYSRVSEPGAAD